LSLAPSELLSGRSCLAAFHCSALSAPSTSVHAAGQPLSCPPRASCVGEAYLIFLLVVRGVDSPYRRLLSIRLIGPDCFLRTWYLPFLADSVLAPTALFQLNRLALEGSNCGVDDSLRAWLLGSLFRWWVGIRPFFWSPSFM